MNYRRAEMKIKTSEATPIQINWLVAKCEGHDVYIPAFASQPWLQIRGEHGFVYRCPKYSTDWAIGGPIIEREKITIEYEGDPDPWCACIMADQEVYGPTPLIAAMRCYVASKLGDTINIPKELT